MAGQRRYLAVVMDFYSLKIREWSLGTYKNTELTRSTLLKALSHRKVKDSLAFHTDRGSEHGVYLIQDQLAKAGIKPSMNRPDSLTDNIHVESFFRTLKAECYHGLYLIIKNEAYGGLDSNIRMHMKRWQHKSVSVFREELS